MQYSRWQDQRSRVILGVFAILLILLSAFYIHAGWSSGNRSKTILVGLAGIGSGLLLLRLFWAAARAA
jgi:hypothetical protein